MEWKDVYVCPAGSAGVALVATDGRQFSVRSSTRARSHGNGGAVFATEPHLRASVQTCDRSESIEFGGGDSVTDHTTIGDLTRVRDFRHGRMLSLAAVAAGVRCG
jgi:hypothetical protein